MRRPVYTSLSYALALVGFAHPMGTDRHGASQCAGAVEHSALSHAH